jgi:hypothetical protein
VNVRSDRVLDASGGGPHAECMSGGWMSSAWDRVDVGVDVRRGGVDHLGTSLDGLVFVVQ